MKDFLVYIGLYNVVGSLLLMALHSEKLGDNILRKYTEIINEPYTHGTFGRLWLWWAAASNLFLGLVMCLSSRWELKAQQEVIISALICYSIMYLVMLFGARKPKYGNGIYVTHALWLVQICWGVIVLVN